MSDKDVQIQMMTDSRLTVDIWFMSIYLQYSADKILFSLSFRREVSHELHYSWTQTVSEYGTPWTEMNYGNKSCVYFISHFLSPLLVLVLVLVLNATPGMSSKKDCLCAPQCRFI